MKIKSFASSRRNSNVLMVQAQAASDLNSQTCLPWNSSKKGAHFSHETFELTILPT